MPLAELTLIIEALLTRIGGGFSRHVSCTLDLYIRYRGVAQLARWAIAGPAEPLSLTPIQDLRHDVGFSFSKDGSHASRHASLRGSLFKGRKARPACGVIQISTLFARYC